MKLGAIDLNLLVTFDAILQTGSVRGAAQRVGLSKPAVSHALKRLRALIRDEILVRSGQQWILSERARAVAPRVRALLEEARTLLQPVGPFSAQALQREFRIHTTDIVLALFGAALGHTVSREAPEVALRFQPVLSDEAPALRSADVDLAIGVFPDLPGELRTQRLFRDRFVCAVRRAGPSTPGRLTVERFVKMNHVLVAPRGHPDSPVDDALAKLGLRRRVARSVPFFLAALDLVAQGDCIVTLSERLARRHASRFGLRILGLPLTLPPYDVCQVWHPRMHDDPAHRWLRTVVARAAKPGDDGS